MQKLCCIVSAAGQGGCGWRAWERLRAAWPACAGTGVAQFTRYPGHAEHLAAQAGQVETLVCMGGDGIVAEVLSGCMMLRPPRPRLLIVPGGTGNDAARQLGILNPESAVSSFHEGRVRPHDVIKVDCRNGDTAVRRYGLLYASIGFSTGSHIRPWMKRWLPAPAAYLLATAVALANARPQAMRITDAPNVVAGSAWIVVAGNTERAGGGSLCVAPGSRTDDGLLNFTIVRGEAKLKTLIKLLLKAPRGSHVRDPSVQYFPGRSIQVDSDLPCPVDVDGDRLGTTPAAVSVCPKAIEVYAMHQS